MSKSDDDKRPGALHLRRRFPHDPALTGESDASVPDQADLITLLERWLDATTLPQLCQALFTDMSRCGHVSQLLIISRSDDLARTWAVAPQNDDLVRAVDSVLGTSPGRLDLLVGGRGRVFLSESSDTNDPGEFRTLGFNQSATIMTDTPISFAVYWAAPASTEGAASSQKEVPSRSSLTESPIWIAVNTVLRNLARMEQLRALSHIDSVTGIANRSYFNLRLGEEVARARRFQRPLSLSVFDIDHFKSLNDTYGHQTGDAILRQMAEYVRWTIRSIDVFCRLGGDEFAVLMPDADTVDCAHFAERLLSVMAAQRFTFDKPGRKARLAVSMGAAVFPTHATEQERLLWCADMSLLEAKHRGRGQFLMYEDAFGRQTAPPA